MFQPTHPVWGATIAGVTGYCFRFYFNPRTPCGVRRPVAGGCSKAGGNFNPRTPCGVRHWSPEPWPRQPDFNPRTPCGVRRGADYMANYTAKFQSTHPVWGATADKPNVEEGDYLFQSTHPVWGATAYMSASQFKAFNFNPRTPCGVRHGSTNYRDATQEISIHAPRVGCDHIQRVGHRHAFNFNPRTPCGVRPCCSSRYTGVV